MRLDHLLSKELFRYCKNIPGICQDQCLLVPLKHPVEALANSFDHDSHRSVQSAALAVASDRSFRSLLRFEKAYNHRNLLWRLRPGRKTRSVIVRPSLEKHPAQLSSCALFLSGPQVQRPIFENCIASTSINRTQLHQSPLAIACLSVHLVLVFI